MPGPEELLGLAGQMDSEPGAREMAEVSLGELEGSGVIREGDSVHFIIAGTGVTAMAVLADTASFKPSRVTISEVHPVMVMMIAAKIKDRFGEAPKNISLMQVPGSNLAGLRKGPGGVNEPPPYDVVVVTTTSLGGHPEPESVLRDARATLRPGGRLFVCEINDDEEGQDFAEADCGDDREEGQPLPIFTPQRLEALIKGAGFVDVAVRAPKRVVAAEDPDIRFSLLSATAATN